MRKIILIAVSILSLNIPTQAQQLYIYVNSLNGVLSNSTFDTGSRGGSFGVNYQNTITGYFKGLGGLEINTVSCGNNAVLNLGIVYGKDFAPKWAWSVTALTQQGVALFKPAPLYTLGFSALGSIEFKVSEKSAIGLSTGLRWYTCPEYSKYGLISSYLDVPVELSYRIRLGK